MPSTRTQTHIPWTHTMTGSPLGPTFRNRPRCRQASSCHAIKISCTSCARSSSSSSPTTCRQCHWRHCRDTRKSTDKRWQVSIVREVRKPRWLSNLITFHRLCHGIQPFGHLCLEHLRSPSFRASLVICATFVSWHPAVCSPLVTFGRS